MQLQTRPLRANTCASPTATCLQELPAELGSLPCLSQLDARNNQLSSLPPALGSATALVELRVGFNKLSGVPSTLGMLGNLRSLDLRNNTIKVGGSSSNGSSSFVVSMLLGPSYAAAACV